MALLDTILGRPLASSEEAQEALGVATGVPVLGLDALASTGYGPEAALTLLMPLGVLGLGYLPVIMLAIVVQLATLYLSYRQTIAAYPNGGGAYLVAKENLGARAGVWAAVALLLDYLLNVAVGISAGIGAVVSALPVLQPHTLALCLLVLGMLTFVNLRGVRESGLAFAGPTFAFVGCLGVTLGLGLIRSWQSGGHPQPVVAPPALPAATAAVGPWRLVAAFANGLTALTGVEAVSNGVPLFRQPTVAHAQRTLTIIVALLSLFLLAIGYLCRVYHIGAMPEHQSGYQTLLAQLVAAVAGRGVFYYGALASIFIVLTYSAQTSFTDFPRVCRLLAEDGFLPPAFAHRGRRLVFSLGIVILAIVSGLLLIAFGGITERLIPLFAVGAFSAFLFSQAGMVVHWWRQGGRFVRTHLVYNALGALTTGMALVIIIIAKFVEGAWMTVLIAPALAWGLQRIHRHYQHITRAVARPVQLRAAALQPPVVIIPINGWDRVAEKALRCGLLLSDDITAVYISTEQGDHQRLRALWAEKVEQPATAAHAAVPRLAILDSPYRQLYQPLVAFVHRTRQAHPNRLIAVIIPELIEPHWYAYLLHNQHGAGLKAWLYREGDPRTVVITAPWYLRDE